MLGWQSLWVQRACREKTQRDLWWDLILPCLQPLVIVHHTSRSRISPGWSHSPGVNTPRGVLHTSVCQLG